MSDASPPSWRTSRRARLSARAVLALAAGATLAAASPPVAAGWLAPIAVGGLAVLVRGQSLKTAFGSGYVFGLAHLAILLSWLAPSIAPVAWILLSMALSLWSALAGVLLCLALRGRVGPVVAAGAWTTVELARQEVPLGGLPWGRLGFAAVDTPWSATLPYLGVTGTGFALALLGLLGAEVVRSRRPASVVVLGAVGAATLAPTVVPYAVPASGSMVVAAVQPGVPGLGNDVLRHHREITQRLVAATDAISVDVAAGLRPAPEIVVWPESSTAADPIRDPVARAAIDRAADATAGLGSTLLLGAVVADGEVDGVVNQGIAWSTSGPDDARYTKQHLVPFGEYVPLRPLLGGLSDLLDAVPQDMVAGSRSQPWEVAGRRLAGAICFDVAFDDVVVPQVRSGAELIVVQTSNARFIGTAQQEQQFAITRARAAESGRSTVVASINGITGLIGPDGQVQQQAPARDTAVLVGRMSTSTAITPAVRLARPLTLLVIGLGVLGPACVVAQARAGRSQSGPGRRVRGPVGVCRRRRLSL